MIDIEPVGNTAQHDVLNYEVMDYMYTKVVPIYRNFEPAHGLEHISRVLVESLELARAHDANVTMCAVIALYHDIGQNICREKHHIIGSEHLVQNIRLREWFSEEEINVMAGAVYRHRSSKGDVPRNIYDKIIAEADRDLNPNYMVYRYVSSHLNSVDGTGEHSIEPNNVDKWFNWMYDDLYKKYGENGTVTLPLNSPRNINNLRKLKELISNKEELKLMYAKTWNEEVQ